MLNHNVGVGNEFLNRMADMAGLLACKDCTEMACAMRTMTSSSPLPGQMHAGPVSGVLQMLQGCRH